MIFLYNFRCRTRIAGGFMIRDYVANQSKDNNKNLPHERMREEIKHELSHIIRDDFYVDHHVNLVERMVRMSKVEDGDLNGIDFYHHII